MNDYELLSSKISSMKNFIKSYLEEMTACEVEFDESDELIIINVLDNDTRIVFYKSDSTIKGLDFMELNFYKTVIVYFESIINYNNLVGGIKID